MSGGAAVQCIPCGKKLVVKEMSSHIHEHIQYYPQKCNDCDFRCVNKSDLDLHTYETDHTGSVCYDPYKQWLVDTINDDSCFAAKFGVDELLKRKNITALPDTPSTQSSPIVTSAQQQQQTPTVTRVVSAPRRFVELSSDSDDEPQQVAANPKAPAVPVKGNSGVQNRRPEPPAQEKSSDESEDSDDEEIVKLRKELTKNVKCSICMKTVCISLSARQSHVKEKHMYGFTNGPPSEARRLYFQSELEKKTKDAFPNLVWTSTQCPKCPKMRDIKSSSGRISHIYNAHHNYLKRLGCPKAPCLFKTFDPFEFKKHFMESHGTVSNWKLFLGESKLEREFPAKYADYRRKIEEISRLLFPMDIPQHIPESAKNKRKSCGDDDGNDILDISALFAAAPSKPTGPRVAQKRPAESSEEDSDDDDKPTGNKKSAAAAPKPRTSGKEAEGTGREADQDSSHNSSAATVAGETTNSNGVKNGETKVKQENEIKQEPPATPTVLSNVPRFTGRPVPPTTLPNPFPTAEQARQQRLKAEQLRNNGARVGHDGGRSAGYGGSMRGGRGGGNVGRGRAGFNTPSGGGYGGRRLY